MNRITARLEALKQEYESGERLLAELDARRQNLTSTLLRIEGAMTVLRELLAAEGGGEPLAIDSATTGEEGMTTPSPVNPRA